MRWILVVLLAGCGAAEGTDTDKAPLPPMEEDGKPKQASRPEAASDCPTALPGAQLRSEVTADGVALVFTTSGGDAGELRDRVQRMADRHNAAQVPLVEQDPARAPGETSSGMTSTEGAHGMDMHGAGKDVPSRAAVEEISGGARVVFTPTDPAQVGILREHIRVHGKEMAETGCGEAPIPAQAPPPPPSSGGAKTLPEPIPPPTPGEPDAPDRPVTPDQPVTPPSPSPPPPPTGEPFVQ